MSVRRQLAALRQKKLLLAAAAPAAGAGAAPAGLLGWLMLLWPFPAVVGSTFLITWASEVASFFISRGMALAVLALLAVLPEFAVEAVLARDAALDPSKLEYVTANFTGANRILVGLALPLIFFITMRVRQRKGTWGGELGIDRVNSVEVVFLLIPSVYSLSFWFRHQINVIDTVLLTLTYAVYLIILYRLPVGGEEDLAELHGVPAQVMKRSRRFQGAFAASAFLIGGFILFLTVEPFVHNMQVIALALGISAYLVVQYIAPLLSEMPEFLSTTYFARHGKGEAAFSNIVSAKINQWTLLIGMIPLVFAYVNFTAGHGTLHLPLNLNQNVEVLLTSAQGLFAVACLLKLRFLAWEAAALFGLWLFQAVDFFWDPLLRGTIPGPFGSDHITREWVTLIFFALIVVQFVLYRKDWVAFAAFAKVWRTHIRPGAPAPATGPPPEP